MAILVAIRQDIKQIGVLEPLDESGFDELLDYFAFKHAGEIDWCAVHGTGWLTYVRDMTSVHSVPVLHRKSNKRDTS